MRDLTLERQTDRWVALYEDVVAGSHRARPLRLLEVGLGWPPETAFLLRKLQGLAERGLEVRAAATLPRRSRAPWVADVALERLPYWADALPAALVGLAADGLRLLVVQPGRLRALLAARSGAGGSGSRRARLTRLRLHVRLARLRADVVHFEWASFAVECAPLLRVWPAATVVSCHGGEVMVDPFVGRGTRLAGLFGHVDAVHCVAGAVEQAAVGHGLPPARARVIPSAVNTRVFRPPRREPPPDGEFRVVTVAALRWVKGYEYALGAVARLAASGVAVRYEIAGAEPTFERGQLRRILAGAAELGLADRLVLHGHLEERKVVALLQQADVFLQASLSEGMPTAVLEAMACGVPVVATDVGGTREVLADGVEGFLVPARDAAAAAEALRALWEEPERRRTMGRAGRLRTEEFTLERQLDRFEALYRELGSP